MKHLTPFMTPFNTMNNVHSSHDFTKSRVYVIFTLVTFAAQLAAGITIQEGKMMSISQLIPLAEAGDVRAQVILGDRYFLNEEPALEEARKWYEQAAATGDAIAQFKLGETFVVNIGREATDEEYRQAAQWYKKSADQGYAFAQAEMASCYLLQRGVPRNSEMEVFYEYQAALQDHAGAAFSYGGRFAYDFLGKKVDFTKALKWRTRAAELGEDWCQAHLGEIYYEGKTTSRDLDAAKTWFERAAIQGNVDGQFALGRAYFRGEGVPKDVVEAYKWLSISITSTEQSLGEEMLKQAKAALQLLESQMASEQIDQARKKIGQFKPNYTASVKWREDIDEHYIAAHQSQRPIDRTPKPRDTDSPAATGSGFLITSDGYIITNYHVVADAKRLGVRTAEMHLEASVIKIDSGNDLALIKVSGQFDGLPLESSKTVKLGDTVATVGFPNPFLQGFSPKFGKGEIASLFGIRDDPRHFQISVPIQPGNSGGALVDSRGSVVGVVSHKLSQKAALERTGSLVENVNYGIKSSLVLAMIESMPELQAKLKPPGMMDQKFPEIIQAVEKAAVMIESY